MAAWDTHVRRTADGLPAGAGRREFLRLAGLMAGALATTGALAACGDDDGVGPDRSAATLDFGTTTGVLTYAYALEALEADFYTRVVATAGFDGRFSAAERQILTDLRDHEVAHREFLRAVITASGGQVPALTVQYPASVNFGARVSVLETARTFEDLGVGAYNGAARYLTDAPAVLTVAGKIVSVEARHASAIRDLLAPDTDAFADVSGLTGANEAVGLDALIGPAQVLATVQPLLAQTITATNL